MAAVLFRDVAELIAATVTEDKDGYDVAAETRTTVFVDVQSVRREEFYRSLEAGRALKAAFLLRACDYGGQERLEHNGKRYRVVRTYTQDGELLELNCAEEKTDDGE